MSEFRRIVYVSKATSEDPREDLPDILAQSRANNGIDGLSGILWCNGSSFLQLLEGPPVSVDEALTRISRDPRHGDIRLISDTLEEERLFGDWSMACMPGERAEVARHRLGARLARLPADVARLFEQGGYTA